jgi:hypothetical protein
VTEGGVDLWVLSRNEAYIKGIVGRESDRSGCAHSLDVGIGVEDGVRGISLPDATSPSKSGG